MAKSLTTITNNDEGNRGIALANGSIAVLAPGESRDLDVTQDELDDLPEHFSVGKAKAKAKADPEPTAEEKETARLQGLYDKLSEEDRKATSFEDFVAKNKK